VENLSLLGMKISPSCNSIGQRIQELHRFEYCTKIQGGRCVGDICFWENSKSGKYSPFWCEKSHQIPIRSGQRIQKLYPFQIFSKIQDGRHGDHIESKMVATTTILDFGIIRNMENLPLVGMKTPKKIQFDRSKGSKLHDLKIIFLKSKTATAAALLCFPKIRNIENIPFVGEKTTTKSQFDGSKCSKVI
jgi:hypothetical protein